MKSNLNKEYLKPIKIKYINNVQNSEFLLKNNAKQVHLYENEFTSIKNGSIILDFGKELCGGIRLLCFNNNPVDSKIRIRFGESMGEVNSDIGYKNATNDHSVRDMMVNVPMLSDQEWGKTGFRFVRIDALNSELRLINVYAVSYIYKKKSKATFECDDELINQIFNTAKYTVYLTMQESLIEGVKRDRLIWIGDMQPQVSAISYLYNKNQLVEEAVIDSINKNTDSWIVAMPTYSFWLLKLLDDYYLKTNNDKFINKCLPYINKTLKLFNECINESGEIDFSKTVNVHPYFVDWPTVGHDDETLGGRAIFELGTLSARSIYNHLNIEEPSDIKEILNKLNIDVNNVHSKQVVALNYITGKLNKDIAKFKLISNGGHGLSTFMSYFILKAIGESSNITDALNIMKEYYGGMLSVGATTFFEDFNLDWLNNSSRIDEEAKNGELDFHGDHGIECYTGFRHSLCHGWSCGPVQFLYENVLGIKIIEPGYKKIIIKPQLGYLKYVKGSIETPYGLLVIEHKLVNGQIETKVLCSDEIKYEIEDGGQDE